MGTGDEGDRRIVRVLAAVMSDGLDAVEDAIREALEAGAPSDEVILNILARRASRPGRPPSSRPRIWRWRTHRSPTVPATTACEIPVQRHEMIDAMRGLGLKGMAGAFDEAVTTGLQRQRTTMEVLTDLLRADATHRHTTSIRYRMSAAKLPVAKDIDAFVFDGTPVNEGLVRSLHAGSFLPPHATEPPRDCRRPQLLRGRGYYEQDNEQVFTGGSPACGPDGIGSRGRLPIALVSRGVCSRQDRLRAADAARVGEEGRGR